MYQKGELKRESILDSAKRLFFQKGFEAATIKEIAEGCGSPVGLVHYYFKKKQDIVAAIYMDFHNSIDMLIYRQVPGVMEDIFLTHALNNRIYYQIIAGVPQNAALYLEMMKNDSNARLVAKYASMIYHTYIQQYRINWTEEELRAYVSFNFGARREFFLDYLTGAYGEMDIQEGVTMLLGLFPRLMKLDHAYVDGVLRHSLELLHQVDYHELKFLV